jgi:hypothetical protein
MREVACRRAFNVRCRYTGRHWTRSTWLNECAICSVCQLTDTTDTRARYSPTCARRTVVVPRPLAHTPAFCRNRIRLRSWSLSHVPALPLPVASTDHVYVASLILNAAQVRRARRANSNAVTLKLISRPPARHPACRVQVRHASLPDRLRVNTLIYLHCIQRRSRTVVRFCRCVCKRPSESGWAQVPMSQTRPCVECHEPDFGRLYIYVSEPGSRVSSSRRTHEPDSYVYGHL